MIWKMALFYVLLINIIGYVLMGWDKKKARKDQWRVPERRFFEVALLGGSVGCWLGMQRFHHKTKHLQFVVGIPLILIVQIVLLVFLFGKLAWPS